MSSTVSRTDQQQPPEFKQIMGHPAPLWMLFMSEFWERFAFYGIRWALVLYVVAQFYDGSSAGQAAASATYGSYLALVYAAALFGGYVADRVLGYQRSILVGAVFMACGLFMIAYPHPDVFKLGLATIIVGNGLFKPNISAMVGKLYGAADPRRDSGFTIFYMGINIGGMLAPIATQVLAQQVFNTGDTPAYKVVFIAAGIGMVISLVWFAIGRTMLQEIGKPAMDARGPARILYVVGGAVCLIPGVYLLLALGAMTLQYILGALFIGLVIMVMIEGFRDGEVARDRSIAMLLIFVFNILFWMFFEQAGSSFTFLTDKIINRNAFGFNIPIAWYQSVNSLAIILFAPVMAAIWVWLGKRNLNPTIPRKFGLGLIGNGLAFGFLVFALGSMVDGQGQIPYWPLILVYLIQGIGELCLSPIGLSMVTKLAPARMVGLGMGGWFLSTGIGNNLSGIFAAHMSGTTGLSVQSALSGYTTGFYCLCSAGLALFLLAPVMQKLMHGVK
jgi:POT family proton-dependent oligopeptide transporter